MMNTTNTLATESRQNLLAIYSDIHKDATGSRPRDWAAIQLKSNKELLEDIEYFSKVADEEIERERAAQAEQKKLWEAHIAGIMRDNNVDRATALRWDMDAMDVNGDMGYYIYLWNMDYQLENELLDMLQGCE